MRVKFEDENNHYPDPFMDDFEPAPGSPLEIMLGANPGMVVLHATMRDGSVRTWTRLS